MTGFRIALLTAGLSTAASLLVAQQHVQVRTRTLGWPSGWVVKEEPTQLGLVLDYHADTVWIPRSEIVGLESTPAPTLTGAPLMTAGGVRAPRVKLTTGSDVHIGLLAVQDSARVGLVPDGRRDTTWLARSAVTDMYVSVGKQSRAGVGAGIGALAGAIAGGVIGAASYTPCGNCFFDFGEGGSAFAGGFLGAVGGSLLGALIGSTSTTDRWEHVDPRDRSQKPSLRIGIMPLPRGASVGVTLTLR